MTSETSKAEIWHCSFCGRIKPSIFASKIANVFICVDCVHEFLKIQRENQRPTEPKIEPKKHIWDNV